MKKIDLDLYPRRELFKAFVSRDIPTFSVTCTVDITAFKAFSKQLDCGFFVPFSFLLSRTMNSIVEFRHRIIDGEIYEFDQVDPNFTVLLKNRTFTFCDSKHFESFIEYRDHAQMQIQSVIEHPDYENREKHNAFFITNVPWLSFTSITHPYDRMYASIPVIAIGRFYHDRERLLIPVGLQAHHALVDGIHAGDFYEHLQGLCDAPDRSFGEM
jgi:chloramphenicol O-acetyltransferase type A